MMMTLTESCRCEDIQESQLKSTPEIWILQGSAVRTSEGQFKNWAIPTQEKSQQTKDVGTDA